MFNVLNVSVLFVVWTARHQMLQFSHVYAGSNVKVLVVYVVLCCASSFCSLEQSVTHTRGLVAWR